MHSKDIPIIKNRLDHLLAKYGKRTGLDLPYFIRNGFWMAVRQVVGTVCGLALYVVFTHLATQEVFGQYQFILSVLAAISIFSVPGLNTAIIRSAARGNDGDYKKAVKISFFWSLLGIPALLIIGGYYYINQNHLLGIAFMTSSIFFPFFYAPNTWDSFLQGKSRFDISTKYVSFQTIINSIITIIVIFFSRKNILPIVIIYLLSYTFFNVFYFFKSLKYIDNNKKDGDVVRYGWFLSKIQVLSIIAENLDKIIVGAFISPSALAVYAVISFIPLKLKGLFRPFLNILFPKFSTLNKNIFTIAKQRKKLVAGLSLFIFLLAVSYYFFIEKINFVFFGEKYQDYYNYSKYYFLVVLFVIPVNIFSRYVFAAKNSKAILFVNIAYPLIRTVINVILIYKYAIAGAVIAYNLNFVLLFLLYVMGINMRKN